jgi:glutaconate CoA-transferase subunit B
VYRPGGPIALVTNRCVFGFDGARSHRKFRLDSVHPGHSAAEVAEHTSFDYDLPECMPTTPAPSAETLRLLRHTGGAAARRGLPAICRRRVRRDGGLIRL